MQPSAKAATVRLAELTSAEVRIRLVSSNAAPSPVLLLPLGSQEDQGPHAPMGDFMCAERIAVLIAERASASGHDTLVAPVLPFGGRDYFGSIPGGITLSQETLRHVLRDMTGCVLRHGARRLIIVNGHGGNAQAIHDVTQEIMVGHGILVPNFQPWQIAAQLLPDIIGPQQAARAAGHGADPLASIAMHLFPQFIRHDLVPTAPALPRDVLGLQAGNFGNALFNGIGIGLPLEIGDSAVTGEAGLSSASTGAVLTERLVQIGADLIDHLCRHGWGEREVDK